MQHQRDDSDTKRPCRARGGGAGFVPRGPIASGVGDHIGFFGSFLEVENSTPLREKPHVGTLFLSPE